MSTSAITPAARAISLPTLPASRAGRSVHDLLAPLVKLVAQSEVLRADSLGCWRSGEDLLFLPRFFFQRRKVHKPRIKVGIFAGIHGDEPGSVLGLIQLARALECYPEMGRNYQLWLYPLCNPGGYIDRDARIAVREGSQPPVLEKLLRVGSAATRKRNQQTAIQWHYFATLR